MVYEKVQLNERTQIRVTKDTVNGKTFGQIRVWVHNEATDKNIPTRKGVAFDLEHIGAIIGGLEKLRNDADTGGADA